LTTYNERDFHAATHLDTDWLCRAKTLLGLKRQLILQGVPGTGKTHVARSLARLLTHGRDDTVRLVQFHPAYGYEEFVEGIKARTIEVNGRHDITYPVEDGLLCAFATEAARRPAEPHVLLIDEINRGNLPRIFGELLYLLEYRDQSVGLPYSRRGFRLPPNLYLIGTMNAADRSVALIDQALKRRFSFLDMPPDPAVLAAWLRDHPPAGDESFAQTVVALFEGVNLRLRNELGPNHQIGHSYFMVPNLDLDQLRVVWEHHVWPLLSEYYVATPDRLTNFELHRLLKGKPLRAADRAPRERPNPAAARNE
jgi:5-methylcytosine-specific restriction endonuclease McrBC GTP-binding regulatory subunit McrB